MTRFLTVLVVAIFVPTSTPKKVPAPTPKPIPIAKWGFSSAILFPVSVLSVPVTTPSIATLRPKI